MVTDGYALPTQNDDQLKFEEIATPQLPATIQ